MKPCIATVCSLDSGLETILEDYAAGHCDAIDLWLGHAESYLESHGPGELADLLAAHGIAAVAASFQGGLLTSQGDARREHWRHFENRLDAYPSVDGVVALTHKSGCGLASEGEAIDLLRRTPMFVSATRRERLEGAFEGSYRLMEVLYAGRNPYIEAIDGMMSFLQQVLRTGNWPLLRRQPPVFTHDPNPMPEVRSLMVRKLKDVWNG